jgi:hypothetical protein
MTCSAIVVPEEKEKENRNWVDAATLKNSNSMPPVQLCLKKKRRGLEAPLHKVCCHFCHTPTFLFVSCHNAMLSQCCRCLIVLNIPRADVPGEEIDPTVVIEGKEKKRKTRRKK